MAVTLTVSDLETAIQTDTATATRLLTVATALVIQYAPFAPDSIQNEAVIRCAGYLNESPSSNVRQETAGPVDVTYAVSQKDALYYSGAKSLLTRWKKRRAGKL